MLSTALRFKTCLVTDRSAYAIFLFLLNINLLCYQDIKNYILAILIIAIVTLLVRIGIFIYRSIRYTMCILCILCDVTKVWYEALQKLSSFRKPLIKIRTVASFNSSMWRELFSTGSNPLLVTCTGCNMFIIINFFTKQNKRRLTKIYGIQYLFTCKVGNSGYKMDINIILSVVEFLDCWGDLQERLEFLKLSRKNKKN